MIKGHGDDLYRHGPIRANFSSNVYNATERQGLLDHLHKRLDSIGSYPEPEPYSLEKGLADYHGIAADSISVTSGATEAIYLIAQAFRGSSSAVVVPTFSEYADACRLHSHRVDFISKPEEASSRYDMVWLCNPNNPTGRVWKASELYRIVRECPSTIFIVDQSYEYFSTAEVLGTKEAISLPNLLLLHSLTKRFAIPGLRLGYLTAHASLTERIRVCRMPWSVNALAIAAGEYLVQQGFPTSIPLAELHAETERLRTAIGSMAGYEVEPTDTHFMLVRCRHHSAADLKAVLADQYGLLIRDASNFEGLDTHCIRIATQTREQNDWLIDALRSISF